MNQRPSFPWTEKKRRKKQKRKRKEEKGTRARANHNFTVTLHFPRAFEIDRSIATDRPTDRPTDGHSTTQSGVIGNHLHIAGPGSTMRASQRISRKDAEVPWVRASSFHLSLNERRRGLEAVYSGAPQLSTVWYPRGGCVYTGISSCTRLRSPPRREFRRGVVHARTHARTHAYYGLA